MWASDRGRHTTDLGNELHGLTLHNHSTLSTGANSKEYIADLCGTNGGGGVKKTYEFLGGAIPVVGVN